jgi:hypothetical protein
MPNTFASETAMAEGSGFHRQTPENWPFPLKDDMGYNNDTNEFNIASL